MHLQKIIRAMIAGSLLIAAMLLLFDVKTQYATSNANNREIIVFLGDSITNDQHPIGAHFTEKLATMDKWSNLTSINSGKNGDSVLNFYEDTQRVTDRVSKYLPDYVMVFLGLADASYYNNESRFYVHYHWLVDTLTSQNPDAQLFLVRFSWAATVSESSQENHLEKIDKVAREQRLPACDVYSHTKGHEDWYVDGVHPNEVGAEEIAKVLDITFSKWLSGSETDVSTTSEIPTSFLQPSSESATSLTSNSECANSTTSKSQQSPGWLAMSTIGAISSMILLINVFRRRKQETG
ncbi:MAG: SGNH/GDSL hydrolase family protein [Candidatus Thorarchaeota archaeon]